MVYTSTKPKLQQLLSAVTLICELRGNEQKKLAHDLRNAATFSRLTSSEASPFAGLCEALADRIERGPPPTIGPEPV